MGGEAEGPVGVVVVGVWVLMGGEWVGEASGLTEAAVEVAIMGRWMLWATLVAGCRSGRPGGSM